MERDSGGKIKKARELNPGYKPGGSCCIPVDAQGIPTFPSCLGLRHKGKCPKGITTMEDKVIEIMKEIDEMTTPPPPTIDFIDGEGDPVTLRNPTLKDPRVSAPLPKCRFRGRGRGGKCQWDNPPFPEKFNCRDILINHKCPNNDITHPPEFISRSANPFIEPAPTPCATQEIADELSAKGFKVRVINDQEKKELKGGI